MKVTIRQVSRGQQSLTKKYRTDAPERETTGQFNRTFKKVVIEGVLYRRYPGSHWSGGNWIDDDGNAYIIEQKK